MRFFLLLPLIIFFPGTITRQSTHKLLYAESKLPVKHTIPAESKWSGSLSMVQRYVGITGNSERQVDVYFTNALPTLDRDDPTTDLNFTDDKGTGRVKFHGDGIIGGKLMGVTDCTGNGQTELHEVYYDLSDSTYRIHAIGPECVGTSVSYVPGDPNPVTPYGPEATDIIVNSKGSNPNFLSGSETVVSDIGVGKVTTTTTWTLVRGPIDAELIVTPIAYDAWLPKATPDELRKGSVMDIKLNVQGRNGRSPSLKVVRFELRLNNTSKEPGTTLNTPLVPSTNQLPDIRFLPHTIGESIKEDQFIEIPCADGKTGTATIGSYDGGGWTTLTAVAVLQGGLRIEGMLLRPGGVKEIPIPKRDPASHIGTTWLSANGNPGEMDDKEKKVPNPNIGDGLTAYEEYRGVISKGDFTRLKPVDKELGVMVKRAEATLFEEGIKWLENASGLKIIRFDETEIGADRRLNKNFLTAHDYDQYVLKIENGGLGGSAAGENQPENIQPKVPKQSEKVVIDVNKIKTNYQSQAAMVIGANMSMPYTENEDLANTVAHELGHGIHIIHHGKLSVVPPRKAYATSNPPFHIYWINSNTEETARPYPVPANDYLEDAGIDSCDASGDLNCIMAYTSLYNWAYRVSKTDGSLYYYKTPLLAVGKKLCTSKKGTGINDPSNVGVNNVNKYFGNAENGNCLNQIKLRD